MSRMQARAALFRTLPILAAPALAACAASSDYPSLAIRQVERVQGSATPVAGSLDLQRGHLLLLGREDFQCVGKRQGFGGHPS